MNEPLLPMNLGPINPDVAGLLFGVLGFGIIYAVLARRLLPRIDSVIAEREKRTEGAMGEAVKIRKDADALRDERETVLADARHEAARTRQHAHEEGMALIIAARAEGLRERERIIAEGAAAIEAEKAVAEAELRADVDSWGRALADRVIGEPLTSYDSAH